jgi:hypothetical protein
MLGDTLAAFYVSTDSNPNSFSKFSQVNSFFQLTGEGMFCIPLNLASSNVTGLHDGQNVTIQVLNKSDPLPPNRLALPVYSNKIDAI